MPIHQLHMLRKRLLRVLRLPLAGLETEAMPFIQDLTVRELAMLMQAVHPQMGRPRLYPRCPRCGRRIHLKGGHFGHWWAADLISWHTDPSTKKGQKRGRDWKARCPASRKSFAQIQYFQKLLGRDLSV